MMEVRNAHQRHYTSRVLPGVGICIVVSTFYLIMFSNHANYALGNVYNVCVVPENSHTSPQRATEILRGGGVQKMVISKGVGMLTVVFFPVGLSKIGIKVINKLQLLS